MKTQNLDYNFVSTDNITVLNFSKKPKDFLDLLIFGITGIICLFCSIGIILLNKDQLSIIIIVIALMCLFVGVLKILQFFTYLFQLINPVIQIDKNSNIISYKTGFVKKHIKISNVKNMDYSLIKDFVNWGGSRKYSYHIEVHITLKDSKRVQILTINPKEIIDNQPEKKLLSMAKPLIKQLSTELQIRSYYLGMKK